MRAYHFVFSLLFSLSFGLGFSTSASANGLDQLKSYLNTAHAARGEFTQTVIARSGRKPQQSSGSFAFQRPGKFRWIYEKPYAQLLVSDGEKFWSYDQDLNQVAVKKIGQALGATPAALLAGESLDKNFVLKDAGESDGIAFVEATPKTQDATFERIRIGLVGNQPRVMEIHDNFGQITLLRFTRFVSNPDLAADLFRFVPPKGADVAGE
jgi:outer membrane lipoprotein carrier protein